MAKIIWEGNKSWNVVWNGKQAWDKEIEQIPINENWVQLKRPDDFVKASGLYMIPAMLLCFLVMFFKAWTTHEFPLDVYFLIPSFIIGFLIGIPIHELFHALAYPKEATVYIGIDIKGLKAYAVSSAKLKRGRFILMSLAPASLGFIAMVIFLVCPITLKWLMTLAFIPMFMGLITPAPDYMDVTLVLKQVPKNAWIQPVTNGFVWYKEESR